MKRLWVITLFPEYFTAFKQLGVIGSTLKGERGPQLELNLVNLRDFSPDKYKSVDSLPYGGGHGMILRADILKAALLEGIVKAGGYAENWQEQLHVVLTSPRGRAWKTPLPREWSERLSAEEKKDIVFICGRYEGVDERFIRHYVHEEISVGDFILSGGELAVQIILDTSLRFLPGVLGNQHSAQEESFEEGLLEHPLYTYPREFNGEAVPEILLSGHHKKIQDYKLLEKKRITEEYRPDLIQEL